MLNGYYVLFRHGGAVKAADATGLVGNCFPDAIAVCNREYRIIRSEDTFFFWDELIDGDDRTGGFTFLLPFCAFFRRSRILSDSTNTLVDGEEVRIDLCPGRPHQWESVQGFGSEVYQAIDDSADHAILMMNWSGRAAGFDIIDGAVSAIPEPLPWPPDLSKNETA